MDIAFERVITRINPLGNTRRVFELDGRNVSVKDSWIEGAYDVNSSDSQSVTSWYGQGVSIINNFIKGTTEVIAVSGAPSPIVQPGNGAIKWNPSTVTDMAVPTNVEVAYNDVTVDELWRAIKWSPGAAVPYGQVMLPSSGGSIVVRAMNEGITGSAEPTWSLTALGGANQRWNRHLGPDGYNSTGEEPPGIEGVGHPFYTSQLLSQCVAARTTRICVYIHVVTLRRPRPTGQKYDCGAQRYSKCR